MTYKQASANPDIFSDLLRSLVDEGADDVVQRDDCVALLQLTFRQQQLRGSGVVHYYAV